MQHRLIDLDIHYILGYSSILARSVAANNVHLLTALGKT